MFSVFLVFLLCYFDREICNFFLVITFILTLLYIFLNLPFPYLSFSYLVSQFEIFWCKILSTWHFIGFSCYTLAPLPLIFFLGALFLICQAHIKITCFFSHTFSHLYVFHAHYQFICQKFFWHFEVGQNLLHSRFFEKNFEV